MSDSITSPAGTDTVLDAAPPDAAEPTRLVPTGWDEAGRDTAQSVLTDIGMTVRAQFLSTPDLVIPVLFVPGIMGTRLRMTRRDKGAAWFPPENTWDGIVMLLQHLGRSAADRQRLLDPHHTEVDDNGPAYPSHASRALLGIAPGKTDDERARWRGWGQLHGDSYGAILSFLEARLAMLFDPASGGKTVEPHWQAQVMARREAAACGAQKPFAPLSVAQLQDAAEALYPVHAVGYNWLQSNQVSGEHLAREIERITAYYRGKGKTCEKVILVTHSMGGLVARACARNPEAAGRILGVVHGVMPAIGAPATYKRMRAGFESVEQVILGRNAAECTAVMANAPGPLELLPTAQYRAQTSQGRRHWLRACHVARGAASPGGTPREQEVLLGEDNPYAGIYLDNGNAWWRLVKEELIDPAGREEREKAKKAGRQLVETSRKNSDFEIFRFNMDAAMSLHHAIEDQYHPNTYAFYAADAARPSWNEVHWKSEQPLEGDIRSALLDGDDFNGTLGLAVGQRAHRVRIDKASGPGDGTVPAESGQAPTPHVVQIFRHEGKAAGHDSYDHQHCYKSELVQAVTLYSIVRIVADSPWVQAQLKKRA